LIRCAGIDPSAEFARRAAKATTATVMRSCGPRGEFSETVMNVDIKIERSVEVDAPFKNVVPLLEDLEGTIKRFPKLRKLTKLGNNAYLWEMSVIGSKVANIAHEVSYGAKYSIDAKRGELSWQPIPDRGNATIEGRFKLLDQGSKTKLIFDVRGKLRDVPVPLMYRLLAPPFIQGKFTRLVDTFLESTRDAVLNAPKKR
jgi:carbon monoxide dehydrogenase subunit G